MRKAMQLAPVYGLSTIKQLGDDAQAVLESTRTAMLAPTSDKEPPMFTAAQVAELCQVDRSTINRLSKAGKIPAGRHEVNRILYTLEEAITAVQHVRSKELRNVEKTDGVVIAVAIFKGGVSKTTTTATLAQGLSLRGHRVLVIDTDPQGSLTSLFGYKPGVNVDDDMTVVPLCLGPDACPNPNDPVEELRYQSLAPAIQATYWHNIDIVCASPSVFNAELVLPTRQRRDHNFKFWDVLNGALNDASELRKEYDVILIDTPPSLSYITINALMAADGLIMPLPPANLDFASSSQFWGLFGEVVEGLSTQADVDKKYSFIDVLFSKVDRSESMQAEVRQWILNAYRGHVLPIEIPKTATASTASAAYGTVYDMEAGSTRTVQRAKEAYEGFIDIVEEQIYGIWNYQVNQFKE